MNFRQWAWKIDKAIFTCIIILELFGLLTVLKLSPIMSNRFHVESGMNFFFKHCIYITLSLINIFIFSHFSPEKTKKVCIYLFFIFLFLNISTVVLGRKINGTRRWLQLFGFSLQPSEFVKTLIVFPISYLLSLNLHKYIIGLMCISAASCLLQPDLGMTFLIISSSASLVFLKGDNYKQYLKLLLSVLVGIILSGIFITKYAVNRILIFLGKKEGFQIQQSLKLIASSKIIGEDSSNIYVPDSHCDFMFVEIVSGFGLMAGFIIICIPIFILFRVLKHKNHISEENLLIVIGIAIQINIQTYFHILSNLGFLPTKGLNLPFASFGGSSLIAHSIAIGALLSIISRKIKMF